MKKKICCFDIDNVICRTYKSDYKNSRPLKKNMDKLTKKISKARKIYRIDNTLLNLEKLNKYEMEYRQLYNSYWYDSIYKLGDFR